MGHLILKLGTAGVPVAICLLLAANSDLLSEPRAQLGCRILPNTMVPVLTGRSAGCVLNPYDRVIAARIGESRSVASRSELELQVEAAIEGGQSSLDLLVVRRGQESWLTVPVVRDTRGQIVGRFAAAVLVSAVVMAVSLMILWGSTEAAATPFAYFYACVSVVVISVLCGRYSDVLVFPGVVATGLIPATLAHLALTFPREREIVQRAPPVIGVLYAFSALFTLIAVLNLTRSPTVWALVDRAILVMSLVTWSLLVISCVLAVRESKSILERARAKVLLAGTAAVPALSLAVGLSFASDLPGGSLALMTITVAVLPLPIGYAISHYRLFDLGLDLRRTISYVLYVAASAAVISGLVVTVALGAREPLPFGDPVVLFTVAFCGFLVGDPLRARLRGAIDSWMAPRMRRMAAAAEEHGRQVAGLLEPDDCARSLCQTVLEGVEPNGVSVFLAEAADWRLAHACGSRAPVQAAAARMAAKAVRGTELVYLADEEPLQAAAQVALRDLGIEIAATMRSGDEMVGLLLITASGRGSPYTSPQLRFIEAVANQSAVAIHNANLARDLAASERLATQGRVGAGLIHDLGKPLGVIESLAKRLPQRSEDRERLTRDARTMEELASQMRATLRDFLDATHRAVTEGHGQATEVDALIDQAVRIVERTHGRDRVSVRLQPDLPALNIGGEKVVRALANLLDNALLASDANDVVEVAAIWKRDALELAVIDRGCGMEELVLERAFEPFFTTRPPNRGSGLGLAVCRDLIEGMGGDVELRSTPGRGTRARVRIPLAKPGSGHA